MPANSAPTLKSAVSNQANSASSVSLPCLSFEVPHICDVEAYLRSINYYYDWYCSQNLFRQRYTYNSALASVFENLRSGRHILSKDATRSFRFLNEACANVKVLFHEQPYQFINQLMAEFFQPTWSDFTQVKSAILGFISRMASHLLNRDHPLSRALQLMQNGDILTQSTPVAIGLASVAVQRYLGSARSETWQVNFDTVTSLLEIYETPSAESRCVDMIIQARQKNHCPAWIERYALEKLAWMRWRQEKYDEAELLCLVVLWQSIQAKGTPIPHGSGRDACQILGELCLDRRDYEGAEIWHTLCLESAVRSSSKPIVMRHLETLEETLELQGKFKEIDILRKNLSGSCPTWESDISWSDTHDSDSVSASNPLCEQ